MKKLSAIVGLRTIKTAAAIIIALAIVSRYGASSAKLIFAMLGAMSAVQPTFRASLDACLTQIVGVSFGAVMGLLLRELPISYLTAIGIGVIIIITVYNSLHVSLSPSLPSFILVMVCTTADLSPLSYALGRIWDTAIGLGVGILVDVLVFPYDNSRKIQGALEGLDRDVLRFLEEIFDGDDVLPDGEALAGKLSAMEKQLAIFSKQKLFFHLGRQKRELARFRSCDRMAKELVCHMEALCLLERPGRLTEENRRRLDAAGAEIRDGRPLDSVMELDVVTNYHVGQLLTLRQELLQELETRS